MYAIDAPPLMAASGAAPRMLRLESDVIEFEVVSTLLVPPRLSEGTGRFSHPPILLLILEAAELFPSPRF